MHTAPIDDAKSSQGLSKLRREPKALKVWGLWACSGLGVQGLGLKGLIKGVRLESLELGVELPKP